MLFTSYSFIGFILLLVPVYYLVPKKRQWFLLLLASCFFYCTFDPVYLIYVLITAVTVWGCAMMMSRDQRIEKEYLKEKKEDLSKEVQKAYKAQHKRIRTAWMILGIVINLGILILVKYYSFFAGIFTGQQQGIRGLAVPLGISFYTLQALGYLTDVKRGTVEAERNPLKMLLFISFFPQVIQGPISRFKDLSETLFSEHEFDWKEFSFGFQRVLWGFFKKLIIADRIAPVVNTIVSDVSKYRGAYITAVLVLYSLELYADFTGGIDVTIGVSQMLGVKVTENFEQPYFSTSLKEYWRKWHITMSQWFREFVFYPVSTSKPIQGISKLIRKKFGNKGKKIPVYLSSFIVWLLTGLWHGASWTFIVWGLLNWFILMVSEELEPVFAKFREKYPFTKTVWYRIIIWIRTFILICILNLFDCYATVGEVFSALWSVLATANMRVWFNGEMGKLGMAGLDYFIILLGAAVMFAVSWLQTKKGSVREFVAAKSYPVRFAFWFIVFITVLLVGAYGIGYDASQFIYNRF